MIKLITGIILGTALTFFVFAGPYASTATSVTTDQVDQVEEADLTDGFLAQDKEDILDFLKLAETEINDNDISEYYRLLIEQFDLVDSVTVCGNVYSLPDIDKIVRQAASQPLQRAGKNIQDDEIAYFYHDFLEQVGWEFD